MSILPHVPPLASYTLQRPSQSCPPAYDELSPSWGIYLTLRLNIWVESLGYDPDLVGYEMVLGV